MADLDHFKAINDTHGHPAGDSVRREAARRLGETVRPYDGAARYGGEEFLVILPGCDLSAAAKVAERLRTAVSEAPHRHRPGPDLSHLQSRRGLHHFDDRTLTK